MKHPTISKRKLQELALVRLRGETVDVAQEVAWGGKGDEIDLEPIGDLSEKLSEDLDAFRASTDASDRDLFEGRAAGQLHAELRHLPLLVLDDPGFWRYLTIVYFWDLVRWRESATFEGDFATYQKYIDGTNPAECVLIRMYLRGQISLIDGDYGLGSAVPKATDLWRSHILRVRTSSAPVVSRALVEEQAEARMPTQELRAFVRRLNRIRSNVVVDVYESTEARELLDELRRA